MDGATRNLWRMLHCPRDKRLVRRKVRASGAKNRVGIGVFGQVVALN